MRNPLTIAKNLDATERAARETAAREKEVQEFDLAQLDHFLSGLKYLIFAVLGALNVRLFLSVVGGVWGLVIGLTAAFFEVQAVYCWNKMRKAGGAYQAWLFRIAAVFTLVSVVHACTSFYDLIHLAAGWPSLGRPLYLYSHVVAFPLLFLLMIGAICILFRVHWSRDIADAQARAAVDAARERGKLLVETARMRNEDELSRARLASYQERLKIEQAFLGLLEDTVRFEQRASSLLAQIPDPQVRQRMADLLGRDANHNGKPDILESPQLQAEAREILAQAAVRPLQPSRN